MEKPISTQIESENEQIRDKIANLESEISQKKKLLDYYKRKIWHNELMILKQSKP